MVCHRLIYTVVSYKVQQGQHRFATLAGQVSHSITKYDMVDRCVTSFERALVSVGIAMKTLVRVHAAWNPALCSALSSICRNLAIVTKRSVDVFLAPTGMWI